MQTKLLTFAKKDTLLQAFVVLSTALVAFITSLEPASAIVNGQNLPVEEELSNVITRISSEGMNCSAIIVGPDIALTSAACIMDGQAAKINSTYTARCERMPSQELGIETDYALCQIKDPLPSSIKFLSISRDRPENGDEVLLIGYGCRLPGGLDGHTRLLTLGKANIVDSTRSGSIVTEGAAACYGDSGGAVLKADETGDLALVGIISRSDLNRVSYIAPIANDSFLEWAENWSKGKNLNFCFLNPGSAKLDCNTLNVEDENSENSLEEIVEFIPEVSETALHLDTILEPQRTILVNTIKGETIRQLVERNCGPQTEEYFEILENWSATSETEEGKINDEFVFLEDGEFYIPDCVRNITGIRTQTMRVETSLGLWEFWEKVKEIEEAENAKFGWESWAHRDDVTDPLRLFEGTASLDSKTFIEVLRALNPDIKTLELNMLVEVPISPKRTLPPASVEYAAEVEPILSMSEAVCAPQNDGYPYNIEDTLDVLALNDRPGVRSFDPKRPVSVLVADSGLLGADAQEGSVFGLGVNANSSSEVLRALTPVFSQIDNPKDRHHGTHVASMVLGGPVFARINAQRKPPIIKIHPIRLYTIVRRINDDESVSKFVGLPQGALENALRGLGSVDIVNLSLKSKIEIEVLRDHLKDDIYLFVVAAGNEDGKIDIDGSKRVLPAQWGGRGNFGQDNLIVVAAIQANGEIVEKSNYGPAHIEIGAPGCDVPALEFDEDFGYFRKKPISGTSFAAPLVSFASALVRGEHGIDVKPHEIKRRILVSADLSPALADHIEHGKILNIPKAITLYHDIVQDIRGNIYRGSLVWYIDNKEHVDNDNVLFDCDEGFRGLKPENILKLWFGYPRADGTSGVMVYSKNNDSTMFDANVCAIPDSNTLRVDIVDAVSEELRGIPTSDLLEVLPKMHSDGQ